LVICWV